MFPHYLGCRLVLVFLDNGRHMNHITYKVVALKSWGFNDHWFYGIGQETTSLAWSKEIAHFESS